MDPFQAGQLVTVATGGPAIDAIVVNHPSAHKVVVALVDPQRGPAFRTVAAEDLSEREDEGPADKALRALIRRSPGTARGGATAGGGAVHGGSRGHARQASHRTTGK